MAARQLGQMRAVQERLVGAGINRRQLTRVLHLLTTRDGNAGVVRQLRGAFSARYLALAAVVKIEVENHQKLHDEIERASPVACVPSERARCASDLGVLALHFTVCTRLLEMLRLPKARSKQTPVVYRDLPAAAGTPAGALAFLQSKGLNIREVALLLELRAWPDRPVAKCATAPSSGRA